MSNQFKYTEAQSTHDSANIWQQGAQQPWKYGNQLCENQGWWG